MEQFQWILVATLIYNLVQIDSKNCSIIQIEQGEQFISERLNVLIIESDQDEFSDLNYAKYKIINESLKFSNFLEIQIISTQIIENYSFKSIDDKLFCIFIKSQIYQITCIRVFNLYSNEVLNYKENKLAAIEMQIQDDYFCQDFFLSQEAQFQIFCQKNNYLTIYSVDLNNTINLQLQQEIPLRQYELCKRTVFQLENNTYLICFFKCEDWGLYQYNNQEMKTILNEQLALNIYAIQIKYLENIQICLKYMYLLIQTGVHLFIINQFNHLQYQIFCQSPQYLIQIALSQSCNLISFVLYDSSINKTTIQSIQQEFEQQFEGRLQNVKLLQGIFMVQTQNELQVIYNSQFNQTIKMNSNYVIFNDQHNLIYLHDEIANEIIFYKFSYPRNLIQPTKKYIFYVFNYQQDIQICREIQYITQNNSNSVLTLSFNNKCQNTQQLFYSKKNLQLPYQYEIKIDKDYKFEIKISDIKCFFLICSNLKNINQQDIILLYYESQNQGYAVLKKQFLIYVQNCYGGLPKFQINTRACQVFYCQSYLLLFFQNKNVLKLINFQNGKIVEIKVSSEIKNIVQFKNCILIFTSNSKDIQLLDLHLQDQIILDYKIIKILKILNEIYLQEKSEIIEAFYYSRTVSKFIQYLQFLIVEDHQKITLFRLENIQIVFLKGFNGNQFFILGIHLKYNQIIIYHFDFQQLQILYNLQLGDYEIIRPLNYDINEQYLAIASRKEKKNFVLIFEIRFTKSLKLIKILEISKFIFFFNSGKFFYYNSKDEITIFNFSDFEIQLENLVQQEMEDISKQVISFSIIQTSQTDPILNITFTINIYDECYRLFPKKSNYLMNYSQYQLQKIIISDFFHGVIDSIKIQDDNVTQIFGPLLLSEITYNQNNKDGIIIKIVKLEYLYKDNSKQQLQLLYYNRGQDRFIFYEQNAKIINVIVIDEERILILFQSSPNNCLNGNIYQIEQDSLNFVIRNQIFSTEIILYRKYEDYRIFKTGNLIAFQSETSLIIYIIINKIIHLVENYSEIQEIHKIQGNNNYYITLSQVYHEYFFLILSFIDDHYISKGNVTLPWDSILNEFKYLIYIENDSLFYYASKCQILESIIIEQNLQIVLFHTFRQYSILSHIEINLETFSFSFIPQKFFRNGMEQDFLTLEFYNKCILILKSIQNVIYFYDLNQDSKFYDYIGRLDQNNYSYFSLNTTHFLVFSKTTKQIKIGELGYKIDLKDKISNNQTFKLIALNQVSQAHS
ncbi:unnamed protein product [Paramecium sonneborni]|uniref:Uncharacterized protein n=1 Tax=Paramecium sonneborni TaxID=65129 RepID=A0A8S1PKV6_9CILI|nr:unnamed protein product [Paramecium sonneborni]